MKITVQKEAPKGQVLSLEDVEKFVSQVKDTKGHLVHGIQARVTWGGRLKSLAVVVDTGDPADTVVRDIGTRRDKA